VSRRHRPRNVAKRIALRAARWTSARKLVSSFSLKFPTACRKRRYLASGLSPATKARLRSVVGRVVQLTLLNVYCVSNVFGSTFVTLTSIASLPSAVSRLQVMVVPTLPLRYGGHPPVGGLTL